VTARRRALVGRSGRRRAGGAASRRRRMRRTARRRRTRTPGRRAGRPAGGAVPPGYWVRPRPGGRRRWPSFVLDAQALARAGLTRAGQGGAAPPRRQESTGAIRPTQRGCGPQMSIRSVIRTIEPCSADAPAAGFCVAT
jgi:hypothetical protein